jgi:PX domain
MLQRIGFSLPWCELFLPNPPRPDKHATRALEEASTQQSAEFAMQRAAELELYLNQCAQHPIVGHAAALRLFLSLHEDLGVAWPEVSGNALTRFTQAGVGAAVKVSETASSVTPASMGGSAGSGGHGSGVVNDYGEDNADILALQASESMRMGAVLQAVPKLDGAVTLIREHSEQQGAVGMELSRLSKEVEVTDRDLGQPIELVAAGLLRAGRRSKRLAFELTAAVQTFHHQFKLCRYERAAFTDRKTALARRYKERGRYPPLSQRPPMAYGQQHQQYPQYGQQSYMQQQPGYGQQQPYGAGPMMSGSMMHPNNNNPGSMYMDPAMASGHEADEVAATLKSEVNRIAYQRRFEWYRAVKVLASAMKEASAERVGIWESIQETFLHTFPLDAVPNNSRSPGAGTGPGQGQTHPGPVLSPHMNQPPKPQQMPTSPNAMYNPAQMPPMMQGNTMMPPAGAVYGNVNNYNSNYRPDNSGLPVPSMMQHPH